MQTFSSILQIFPRKPVSSVSCRICGGRIHSGDGRVIRWVKGLDGSGWRGSRGPRYMYAHLNCWLADDGGGLKFAADLINAMSDEQLIGIGLEVDNSSELRQGDVITEANAHLLEMRDILRPVRVGDCVWGSNYSSLSRELVFSNVREGDPSHSRERNRVGGINCNSWMAGYGELLFWRRP